MSFISVWTKTLRNRSDTITQERGHKQIQCLIHMQPVGRRATESQVRSKGSLHNSHELLAIEMEITHISRVLPCVSRELQYMSTFICHRSRYGVERFISLLWEQ